MVEEHRKTNEENWVSRLASLALQRFNSDDRRTVGSSGTCYPARVIPARQQNQPAVA
jgi:hypothetical protein